MTQEKYTMIGLSSKAKKKLKLLALKNEQTLYDYVNELVEGL